MRVKILAAILVISVGFNIAGLVFFINWMRLQGSYKGLKRERNIMLQNLTAVRASSIVSDGVETGKILHRRFNSHVDGVQDFYALQPPSAAGGLDNILVVYLHGMGSSELEPFTYPTEQTIAQAIAAKYPEACILSCSYRKKASWGVDSAMSDITQNIRGVLQEFPFKKIVLVGTSMGGCTALTYATEAPKDIQEKLCGIVSVEGAGDLAELAERTGNSSVAAAIAQAMGGDSNTAAAEYKRKSFLPNLAKLSPSTRVAVISAAQDTIVPPDQQEKIVQSLSEKNIPVKLIKIEEGHGVPSGSIYVQGLDFALGGA